MFKTAIMPYAVRDKTAEAVNVRPSVRGKFIFVGEEKFYVRGVTYGTFRPNEQGEEFPAPKVVERDFAQMAEVRGRVGHPAILCYTIGNEIPSSIVRWHGRHKLERFLERLCRAAKAEDPNALVTYVNYPSTEYLQLPFLDFVCFNVYLESQKCLDAYLASLHTLAGDRPLVMAELGLDSYRNGEEAQAHALDWQIRTVFADGCAGVFVYAWTDEWFRGGAEVMDWEFGITTKKRRPKPALAAVREAFAEVPFGPGLTWPRVTVLVCSHNGSRTIRECCEGLLQLEYPSYEVIVVDDGSTDQTAAIAGEFGFRVIRTPNRGLSNARNVGLDAAKGEIVAYIDDDAYPDPHWLTYLVAAFMNPRSSTDAGMGGPNIPPPEDGLTAHCVAMAPGGPSHVLLTDRKAEHIPGCNMAFRKAALAAAGGFDPQFRVAGDDVDLCWRLQEAGWTLGFSPGAVVWHHRRGSIRAYWRQQSGYGKAEAMLERKWPQKYNAAGHLIWSGRVYGNGLTHLPLRAGRIYHGIWGLAPFQSLYKPAPNLIEWLPMMPEWYFIVAGLALLSALGLLWGPLLFALPLVVLAVGIPLVQAARCAARVSSSHAPPVRVSRWRFCSLTALLHLLQPLARLYGRVRYGLTFWRSQSTAGYTIPRPWMANIWTNLSRTVEQRLQSIEGSLRANGATAIRGGDYDQWDLETNAGVLGSARIFMAVDHHGSGRQLLRIRCWPLCSPAGLAAAVALAGLSVLAGIDQCWTACLMLGILAAFVLARTIQECAVASAAFLAAVRKIEREEKINLEASP
jgi:GT2 family glycosyltransferase